MNTAHIPANETDGSGCATEPNKTKTTKHDRAVASRRLEQPTRHGNRTRQQRRRPQRRLRGSSTRHRQHERKLGRCSRYSVSGLRSPVSGLRSAIYVAFCSGTRFGSFRGVRNNQTKNKTLKPALLIARFASRTPFTIKRRTHSATTVTSAPSIGGGYTMTIGVT